MDLTKHKELFLAEAKSNIKIMNRALVELEKSSNDKSYFHKIFRAVHTLKSLSATMNYQQTSNLCHSIEDVLEIVREKPIIISENSDFLFKCFDHLSATIKAINEDQPELDSDQLINQCKQLLAKKQLNPSETISNNSVITDSLEKIQSIDVKVERLDMLMNLTEELLVNKMQFDVARDKNRYPELLPAIESLDRSVSELQYHVMQLRLVPVDFIFNRFVRMARDLAKQQKKEIHLQIENSDIELDRMILDQISESIAHLIRNAIDHGLETPEERTLLNKPPQGILKLSARQTKEAAIIEVSDDGRGLDLQAIKNVALKNHLIDDNASEDEIKDLIFSEISTKKVVTEVSGRGVGLSVVKHNIELVNGNIRVNSIPKQGTTFTMEIPLTLAIIKTLFVKVNKDIYAIPVDTVERLLIISSHEIKQLMNDEAIIFEDKNIPLIRLTDLFSDNPSMFSKQAVVIIRKGNERLGVIVDNLLSTQEVVIKPLSRAVQESRYFLGAALIGTGKMVLVLDTAYLFRFRKKVIST